VRATPSNHARMTNRVRTALALATCLPLLAFGASQAGAATSCEPLVSDPAGDVKLLAAVPIDYGSFDLLSLDVASNTKNLTFVVRTAENMRETTARIGRVTEIGFHLASVDWYVELFDGDVQTESSHLYRPGTNGKQEIFGITPAWSADGKMLSVSVPLKGFAALGRPVRPGQILDATRVVIQPTFDETVVGGTESDSASSLKGYTLGAKSCIKP
jgi:hypothetical protein